MRASIFILAVFTIGSVAGDAQAQRHAGAKAKAHSGARAEVKGQAKTGAAKQRLPKSPSSSLRQRQGSQLRTRAWGGAPIPANQKHRKEWSELASQIYGSQGQVRSAELMRVSGTKRVGVIRSRVNTGRGGYRDTKQLLSIDTKNNSNNWSLSASHGDFSHLATLPNGRMLVSETDGARTIVRSIGSDGAIGFATKIDGVVTAARTLSDKSIFLTTQVRHRSSEMLLAKTGKVKKIRDLAQSRPNISGSKLREGGRAYASWEGQQVLSTANSQRKDPFQFQASGLPVFFEKGVVAVPYTKTSGASKTTVSGVAGVRRNGTEAWHHEGSFVGHLKDGAALLISRSATTSKISVIEPNGALRWKSTVRGDTGTQIRELPGGHLLLRTHDAVSSGSYEGQVIFSREGQKLAEGGGESRNSPGLTLGNVKMLAGKERPNRVHAGKPTKGALSIFKKAVGAHKVLPPPRAKRRNAPRGKGASVPSAVVRRTAIEKKLRTSTSGLGIRRRDLKMGDGFDASTDGTKIFIGRGLAQVLSSDVLRDVIVHEKSHIELGDSGTTSFLDSLVKGGAMTKSQRNQLSRRMEFTADAAASIVAAMEGRPIHEFASFLSTTERGADHPGGMERASFLMKVHKAMRQGLGDMHSQYGLAPVTPFVQADSFRKTGSPFLDVTSFGPKALGGSPFMDVRSF